MAFLYYELLILGVFTSLVHWFDAGDVYSYGRFVFFVFVPILFYRHFYQKEKREDVYKRQHLCERACEAKKGGISGVYRNCRRDGNHSEN